MILIIVNFSYAQQLRIGVLRDYKTQRILFSYNNGSYTIIGDSINFGSILQNEFVDLTVAPNGKITLKKGVDQLGTFSKIFILSFRNLINDS